MKNSSRSELSLSVPALAVALSFAVLMGGCINPLQVQGGNVQAQRRKDPLVIVYFVPSDRVPIPGHEQRLDRLMVEVQEFYRRGMEAAGYGSLTFDLPRDKEGKLRIHLVSGRESMRAYGRNDAGIVRGQVIEALKRQGVEVEDQTLLIFQVLLDWQSGTAIEVGPYVGGGDHRSGTAWVYDDALLDPRQLNSKEAGGFYHRPCSIGEFNSHYIGGVAHELGHALGLPHVTATAAQAGHSLMGDGNHTYGEELRGEGSGTYLHPASAMLLARCRPFVGTIEGAELPPDCQLVALTASFIDRRLVLAGKIEAHPPAFGVIAYNDSLAVPADYEATGWISPVDALGGFRLTIDAGGPGAYELPLQVCHTNGATSRFVFRYRVDPSGSPDLAPFAQEWLWLGKAIRAYGRGETQSAEAALAELERRPAGEAAALRQANFLRALMHPKPHRTLAEVPPGEAQVSISGLRLAEESVGWGRPLRDQVLHEAEGTCFLQVADKVYGEGLYAHAPARHVLDLQGKWKQFTSDCGLQDGHDGSVVFVVRTDGREVFRSERIADHRPRPVDLDVGGVNRLELLVEDSGDGATSDWGVWLSPTLTR